MRPSSFSLTKKLISFYLLLVAAMFLLTFVSCKKENKYPTCVKLTKAQIQKWVKNGYITPNDTTTVIRFKVAYGIPGTIYRVYAVVQNKDGTTNNESFIELQPVDTCSKSHIKLDDLIFTGTIQASFSDWNIWKKDAINDSLQYIRFEPFNYTLPESSLTLLALNDYIIKKDGTSKAVPHGKLLITHLLPCPPCPNCKSPCPPICSSCGQSYDSTK